jgi:xylan 1,4-beta-xylosidase
MILPRARFLCVMVALPCSFARPAMSEPAVPLDSAQQRLTNTTYTNPILTADNPADPDVIRVDGTYYLYATTHGRGYDAWTSADLIHWEPRGRVFDDPRRGAWAPDVFHNERGDGKFYLYYTDNNRERERGPLAKQIGVAVADSPLGPFRDQEVLANGAIDAHLFQDDDGQLYLYYVDMRGGFKILLQRMSDPVTKEGPPIEVLRPTEPWEMVSGHITEGPFMLKRNGVYYLMYSGTGADSPNYGIGYATADGPNGPFKKYSGNPIARRREGIYGPGHHCVVVGPDGKLWLIYHQKYNDRTNFRRFIAIDPLWFEGDVIHTTVSRGTEQPGPLSAD